MHAPLRFLLAFIPMLIVMCSCGEEPVAAPVNTLPFDSLFSARQGKKWGWIDRKGNVVIPFVFDSLAYSGFNSHLRFVTQNKKMGCIDSTGNFVVQPLYDDLYSVAGDTLFSAGLNGKRGLVRRDGTVLIPFVYESVSRSCAPGDSIFDVGENRKYGLITKHGKKLTPLLFDRLGWNWVCGKTYYGIGFTWGHVSLDGKIGPPIYGTEAAAKEALVGCPEDTIYYEPHDGRICVYITKTEKSGYMRTDHSWAIDPVYEHTQNFSEGCAAVSKDGEHWFYIDTTGKKLFGNYSEASSFVDSVAFVDSKKIIDRSGKVIAVSEFPIFGYEEDYRLFRVDARGDDFADGEWGLMDRTGHLVVNPNFYHSYGIPSDSMIAVCIKDDPYEEVNSAHDHIWGFVNMEGTEVIPCQFNDLFYNASFSSGLAPVAGKGGYGYMNKKGQIAIPCTYDEADNFNRGLARVWKNQKMKYIDATGKVVWEEL